MPTTDHVSPVGPFNYVFHQVAMYVPFDLTGAVSLYKEMGFTDWTYDSAVLVGCRIINGDWQDVEVEAFMAFNYQIMPMELEFLHYFSGEHRHTERELLSSVPFISHMSVHVDSVSDTMDRMRNEYDMSPYHLFVTQDHTNEHVRGNKRFVECIFDTRAKLGYDIKCIERLSWDSKVTARGLLDE